ncbi:MAG: hypothetical protein PVI12_02005, partial [Gammaproteobacteria bacterium]
APTDPDDLIRAAWRELAQTMSPEAVRLNPGFDEPLPVNAGDIPALTPGHPGVDAGPGVLWMSVPGREKGSG